MAATNFTPISLYYSTTASAVPSAGNLVAGELALNTVDEKLYFKNSAGTVKLLASNAASATSGTSILYGNGSGGFSNVTIGTGVSFAGGTLSATGSGGDVVGPASAVANSIALFNSTTGKLIKDSSASDGLIYGLTVGRGAGAVATNTAVGASALAANTSGIDNSGFGYFALQANTSGNYNTALGRTSLYANTTGSANSALGRSALENNTTGGNNSAVGYGALTVNTTGGNNTALGRDALYSNTTASNNTAVGYQAGYSNTTGNRSVYIGDNAGRSNTTGAFNTFVGQEAGYLNTTGTYNTFVGPQGAGEAMTTGSKNTIIGKYSGNTGGLDIRTASNYIVLSDGDGNPRMYNNATDWYDSVGKLRAVPQSGSSKTSSYTLATTDVGEYILLGASGAIVIPDATFAAGDIITIFNNTASTATITCSITTAYIAGTFTDKATMTLAAAGVATVLFITSTLCVVSGNVT